VILSGMDFHLPQALNRVVTIKTRCVVVVLSVMDLHLHQALNRVVTKKNKGRVCGFVCIGSPPSAVTNQSGYDKTMYVVGVLSTLDLHLLQALNRVFTIKTRYVVFIKELIAYSINHLLRQKNNCQIIVIWLKAYAIFSICCFTNIVASV
jgi:hypothetical protein